MKFLLFTVMVLTSCKMGAEAKQSTELETLERTTLFF